MRNIDYRAHTQDYIIKAVISYYHFDKELYYNINTNSFKEDKCSVKCEDADFWADFVSHLQHADADFLAYCHEDLGRVYAVKFSVDNSDTNEEIYTRTFNY